MTDQPKDEHTGKGGYYRIDPATGQRVLVERAGQPAPDTEPASPEPATSEKPAAKKGARNA